MKSSGAKPQMSTNCHFEKNEFLCLETYNFMIYYDVCIMLTYSQLLSFLLAIICFKCIIDHWYAQFDRLICVGCIMDIRGFSLLNKLKMKYDHAI